MAPTVSSNIPQVGNAPLTVPAYTSQSSGDEETTPHQAAKGQKPGVVRSITVFREKDAIAVLIEGNKPLRAAAATQSNPERIVIDLANVRLHRPRRIAVNAADVRTVSASLYLVNPLITRVVVDLTRPHAYHVDPYGNWLTVRIDTANRTAIEAAGPKAVR
jgi:AMIN domain